jgi:hypothetical protein
MNVRCTEASSVSMVKHVLLTSSMEQSPSSEANSFTASEDIPRVLWKSKFRYRIYKSQINPLKGWNSSNIWEQSKQIKIPFMKKLRADLNQSMLAIIKCRIFYYPKIQSLKYKEQLFCLLFCMGLKLGLSHSGRNTLHYITLHYMHFIDPSCSPSAQNMKHVIIIIYDCTAIMSYWTHTISHIT